MFDELNTENSEIYEYSEDDQIVEATKIQMVLGTLENRALQVKLTKVFLILIAENLRMIKN